MARLVRGTVRVRVRVRVRVKVGVRDRVVAGHSQAAHVDSVTAIITARTRKIPSQQYKED